MSLQPVKYYRYDTDNLYCITTFSKPASDTALSVLSVRSLLRPARPKLMACPASLARHEGVGFAAGTCISM